MRSPLWDATHAAWAFVPLMDRNETDAIGWLDEPPDYASRLAAFCGGFGLGRAEVPELLATIVEACSGGGGETAAVNRAFVSRNLDGWRDHLRARVD